VLQPIVAFDFDQQGIFGKVEDRNRRIVFGRLDKVAGQTR
jgi:hypothetical protein